MPIQLVAVFMVRHSQLGTLAGAPKTGVGRPMAECSSGPGLGGGGGLLARGGFKWLVEGKGLRGGGFEGKEKGGTGRTVP